MNRSVLLFLLAAPLASAAGRCTVTAVPQVIAAEGAAEPAGDISVDCTGLSAGQAIRGTVTASFSRRIANRRAGDVLEGPVLELETGLGAWSLICALTGTARSYGQLLFYRAACLLTSRLAGSQDHAQQHDH